MVTSANLSGSASSVQFSFAQDLIGRAHRVETSLGGYRYRLAAVVSNLVPKSPKSDRLQGLFRLNSARDLSGLANVLDDKVISFLNELFGKSSRKFGDWASPHS